MMKIWNPVEAYRKASQHNKNEQIRHEAKVKICIGDYTDSKGVTYNGKDWEAMTLKPGSSMPTTMQAKGGAA